MAKGSVLGRVNGKIFTSLKEGIFLIFAEYFDLNPNISLNEFYNETLDYGESGINDNNKRSLIKSIDSFRQLTTNEQKKFYGFNGIIPNPFYIEGREYYIKTETDEKEFLDFKRFAEKNNIKVEYSPTIRTINLSDFTNQLIDFYISETKVSLKPKDRENLTKIKILEERGKYYELIGYPIIDIIKELKEIFNSLEGIEINHDYFESLIYLLEKLLEIYEEIGFYKDGKPTGIAKKLSKEFLEEIEGIINEILGLIRKIEEEFKYSIFNIRRTDVIYFLPKIEPNEQKINEIKEKIKELFGKIKVCERPKGDVLGSFYANEFKIELYLDNIKDWKASNNMNHKLLDVYSHELFHAFHFLCMVDKSLWNYNFDDKLVKESLARYIEYKYSEKYIQDDKIICNHIKVWTDVDMLNFPYSGAKFINRYVFCELMFKTSLTSFKGAVEMLKSAHSIKEKSI